MYNELLKQHEDILKKLTDKASKETDFGERGQFMNLQKMINNEIVAINDLKRAYKESESNKLCAYKLGVGKILIGQRGSGISSTLIDECLKYNRPLIVEFGQRANLAKEYPNLRVARFVKDTEYFESSESNIDWTKEQVNIDLITCRNNIEAMSKMVEKIRARVGAIGTVGVSYEIEEEHTNWHHANSKFPKVVEESKPNKYVYAYTDFVENKSVMTLIYFDEFDGEEFINISNVRSITNVDEAVEALFMANLMGFYPIVDNTMLGADVALKLRRISDIMNVKLTRRNRELTSEAYCRYSKIKNCGRLSTSNESAKLALDAFEEIKTNVSDGYITWTLERGEERESLLKAILIAYHTIIELNK